MGSDPFGTAALRARVLDAWTASPARFREDANAEEDHALGGYRDRLVVELAQNAADAADRAGVPGRLLLRLDADAGGTLVAANTGAPLDAAGVESLATLRASAKRDADATRVVGRFGVGFAAVLAVCDEPRVLSTSGGVAWSAARTRAEVGAVPGLADELARRAGAVPVLRLPWPAEGAPPAGYDTAVVLTPRDRAAAALVREQVGEVDAALLLLLPALAEVVVEVDGERRVLTAADLEVRQVTAAGRIDPALLADRPTEERRTAGWSVRWAVPRPPGVPAVVHAPTPTDEPLDLPALLVASFPLDPSRRHVAPGPLCDAVVGHAAQAYADLVRTVAAEGAGPAEVLGLAPGPLPGGALDAALRAAVVERLRRTAFLPGGLVPEQALAVDGLPDAAHRLLGPVVAGLLPPVWAASRVLDRLGVRRAGLADLVDELAALDRPPAWWAGVYAAFEGADPEGLAGLPVPLADGRVVRGPRGVVVGVDPATAADVSALGVRVVHPDADAPLLERLGAVRGEPRALLADRGLRAAVAGSLDADHPEDVAAAVLPVVRAAGLSPGEALVGGPRAARRRGRLVVGGRAGAARHGDRAGAGS